VGGLHHYALGWFAGVPLWIAPWWLLGLLVWKDLGWRLLATLHVRLRASSTEGYMRMRATSAMSPRSFRRTT